MTSTSHKLREKEYVLIQEIAKRPTHTQRSLSQSVGLSLGTTNLLIQRLARKGFIKINQLDWKRTQYLLTLKGASEKMNKAYHYTLYTMRLFKQIQENITVAVRREYEAGRREFVVVAQEEMLILIRETVASLGLSQASFTYVNGFADARDADLLLTATLEKPPRANGSRRYVSLVDFDNIDFRID